MTEMAHIRYPMPIQNRLKSKRDLDRLYNNGISIKQFPFKLIVLLLEEESDVKLAVTVPKRAFKRAVDRNLLKRRMREVYRLNNHKLIESLEQKKMGAHLLLIFIGREIVDYRKLEQAWGPLQENTLEKINTYEKH